MQVNGVTMSEHKQANDQTRESTIRVYRESARMIATAASHRGLTIAEFFDSFIRPTVLREYAAALDEAKLELDRELAAAGSR